MTNKEKRKKKKECKGVREQEKKGNKTQGKSEIYKRDIIEESKDIKDKEYKRGAALQGKHKGKYKRKQKDK